jgi:hypothetical protein
MKQQDMELPTQKRYNCVIRQGEGCLHGRFYPKPYTVSEVTMARHGSTAATGS